MKRMLFAVVALAVFGAPALMGPAVAYDYYYGYAGPQYYGYAADPAMVDQGTWDGARSAPSRHRVYAWPDQRYYGVHGMVSD